MAQQAIGGGRLFKEGGMRTSPGGLKEQKVGPRQGTAKSVFSW